MRKGNALGAGKPRPFGAGIMDRRIMHNQIARFHQMPDYRDIGGVARNKYKRCRCLVMRGERCFQGAMQWPFA